MVQSRPARLALPLLLALLLGGCAAIEPDPADEPTALPDEAVERPTVKRSFTADSLYGLLVAELAGGRGDLDTALEQLLAVARESRDPRVAERAARTARYLGRNDEAREAAERWVALQPRSRSARAMIARVHLERGDEQAAAEHMRALIAVSEDRELGLREVAALTSRVEQPETARAALQRLLEFHPESPVLHYAIAHQAAEAGDADGALAAVAEALALDPDYSRAHLLRAEVLADGGDGEAALEGLAEARERLPDDRDLALGEVRLLVAERAHERAIGVMQEVFEAFGDDRQLVNELARTALHIGVLDDARIYFQRQLAMNGRGDEARYYLGRIAERQGDCDEAMSHYIRVSGRQHGFEAQQRFAVCLADVGRSDEARLHFERLRHAYDSDEAQRALVRTQAEIERNAGEPEQALGVVSAALEDHPEDDEIRYMRALIAAESGAFETARDDLEQMLERNPDAPHLQNALGYTLADEGVELERAHRLIAQALAQRPVDAAILDSMGWVLYRKGEKQEALTYLRRAWERAGDAEIGAHLGEVLWSLGEHGEARQIWEAAEDVDPEHRVLQETLERFDP